MENRNRQRDKPELSVCFRFENLIEQLNEIDRGADP